MKRTRKERAADYREERAVWLADHPGTSKTDFMRARLAQERTLHLGRIMYRISLSPDGVLTYRRQTYPAAGAHAEVEDFRSGLVGRKHTATMTITLAGGEILSWHQTDTGTTARLTHNQVIKFAAALNNAAR